MPVRRTSGMSVWVLRVRATPLFVAVQHVLMFAVLILARQPTRTCWSWLRGGERATRRSLGALALDAHRRRRRCALIFAATGPDLQSLAPRRRLTAAQTACRVLSLRLGCTARPVITRAPRALSRTCPSTQLAAHCCVSSQMRSRPARVCMDRTCTAVPLHGVAHAIDDDRFRARRSSLTAALSRHPVVPASPSSAFPHRRVA